MRQTKIFPNEVEELDHVWIPMADGVHLAADTLMVIAGEVLPVLEESVISGMPSPSESFVSVISRR